MYTRLTDFFEIIFRVCSDLLQSSANFPHLYVQLFKRKNYGKRIYNFAEAYQESQQNY